MSDPALARDLVERTYTPERVAELAREIHQAVLRDSPRIRQGNFSAISADDLSLLFDLYDDRFFGGLLRRRGDASGAPPRFALSRRWTRSPGLTKRFPRRAPGTRNQVVTRFEIVISTPLLFQTFHDVQRTVRVNGVVCADR